MRTYIFLGPTLGVSEARSYLDATYLPPIEQGDLLRLLPKQPSLVGIIDGRFQFVPSVWHKEILTALAQGVRVFGAASMGALRAAELDMFGMVGLGKIFRLYKDGQIEDDDEVAVTHAAAEHGYLESSDAMVNIRDACEAALADGKISKSEAEHFQQIAKGLYFPDRNWAQIFAIAQGNGISRDSIETMDRFRRQHIPLKRRDAVELLNHLAMLQEHPPERFEAPFRLENTVFLHQLKQEVQTPPEKVPEVARKKVLLEILALETARQSGKPPDQLFISLMSAWFRNRYGLVDDAAFESFTRRSGLDAYQYRAAMERFAAVAEVQEHYREEIDRVLPAHLALMSAGNMNEWSQWNVALCRRSAAASENAINLFELLSRSVGSLRESSALRQFYFMRKTPDIRLRFRGDISNIDSAIREVLERALNAGLIDLFHASVYEPETALFGGKAAMESVHDYFDADTSVWLDFPDSTYEYSLTILQQCFMETLRDSSEVWQTWQQMTEVDKPALLDDFAWTGDLPIHPRHAEANQKLAEELRALWASGHLKAGLRSILASVAMFHFNRYGIPGPLQAALAVGMAKQVSPLQPVGANR